MNNLSRAGNRTCKSKEYEYLKRNKKENIADFITNGFIINGFKKD
jgi:hypothetical protein